MLGILEALKLGAAALPLFQRRKSGTNLRASLYGSQQEAAAADAEAAQLAPGLDTAQSDFRRAVNARLARAVMDICGGIERPSVRHLRLVYDEVMGSERSETLAA